MKRPYVVMSVSPIDDDAWVFNRYHQVEHNQTEANRNAVKQVQELERKGFVHYRTYANRGENRRMNIYDRTRWGMKLVEHDLDEKPVCRDIRMIPVEEMYDSRRNRWCEPDWMLYDHVAETATFYRGVVDLKLLIAHTAMEQRNHAEFKVLEFDWTDVVNNVFRTIDSNSLGLICQDGIKWSLFPLKKFLQ